MYFLLLGNPIRCDCRLQWIIGARFPVRFHANCAFPAALKDIPLAKLNKKLLQCSGKVSFLQIMTRQ